MAEEKQRTFKQRADSFITGMIDDEDRTDAKLRSFMDALKNSFSLFIPADNHAAFIKMLQDEIDKLNEQRQLGLEKEQVNEYINILKTEITNEQNAIETQDFSQKLEQEIKEIKNPSLEEQFEQHKDSAIERFTDKHIDELQELNVVKTMKAGKKGDTFQVYSNSVFLKQEEEQALKQKFLEASPKGREKIFDDVLDMDKVKQNIEQSNKFINDFKNEKESIADKPSLEAINNGKLNPDTYFTDLSTWFENKRLENLKMPISKEEFKKDFYEYCKNGMSENEMKILVILANKEPSSLSKEHKDMLREGLKLNLENQNLLNQGLDTAIRASIGEKVINAQVPELTKTINELSKTNNLVDKRFCENTAPKLAQHILNENKNLNPTNTITLKAIATNTPIASLSKSMSSSLKR